MDTCMSYWLLRVHICSSQEMHVPTYILFLPYLHLHAKTCRYLLEKLDAYYRLKIKGMTNDELHVNPERSEQKMAEVFICC